MVLKSNLTQKSECFVALMFVLMKFFSSKMLYYAHKIYPFHAFVEQAKNFMHLKRNSKENMFSLYSK